MGWVMTAMMKVMGEVTTLDRLTILIVFVFIALVYTLMSGFWGVVVTDVVHAFDLDGDLFFHDDGFFFCDHHRLFDDLGRWGGTGDQADNKNHTQHNEPDALHVKSSLNAWVVCPASWVGRTIPDKTK